MTRGTRAYLRLDPGFDERKESYPDGPYAALIAVFCLAESQPERGRFRNERFLRALMGRRGRHLAYLVLHEDLVELPDGRLYVDGWDEWQEGDWKVQERLERLRERRERNGLRRNGSGPRATAGATPEVTPSATPLRLSGAVPGGAVAGRGGSGSPLRDPVRPPTWFDAEAPEGPALAWVASHGAALDPNGNGLHVKLTRLVEIHGVSDVVATFEAIAPECTEARQFVLGADNRLNRIPAASTAKPETDQERQLRELTERQEARERAKEKARLSAKGATT